MPRGCDHVVHVHLDVVRKGTVTIRHFVVEFNEDGEALRIKERKPKTYTPRGVSIGVCDVSWWVRTSHPLGSGDTLPKRVIEAARAKMVSEDAARNATP